jgi:hypothetical protein
LTTPDLTFHALELGLVRGKGGKPCIHRAQSLALLGLKGAQADDTRIQVDERLRSLLEHADQEQRRLVRRYVVARQRIAVRRHVCLRAHDLGWQTDPLA